MELVDAPIPNAAEAEGKTKRRATATRKAMDAPRAIAPFDRDLIRAAKSCFDRNTGKPVNASHLKTHAQALLRYHLHPEAKFEGGDYTDAGVTRRRHIAANGIQLIGKEANRWEEQFHLGADPEAQSEYGMQPETREQVMATIRDAVERHSLRAVAQAGHVRKHLLSQAIKGAIALPDAVINRLAAAVVKLDQKDRKRREREAGRIAELRERVQREGLRKVATQINISAGYLSRKMNMLVPTRYPVEGSAYHADEDRAAL